MKGEPIYPADEMEQAQAEIAALRTERDEYKQRIDKVMALENRLPGCNYDIGYNDALAEIRARLAPKQEAARVYEAATGAWCVTRGELGVTFSGPDAEIHARRYAQGLNNGARDE